MTAAITPPSPEDPIAAFRRELTEAHFARLAEKRAAREAKPYQRGRPPARLDLGGRAYAGDNWWVGGE